jgi:hypothetical protein
VDNPWTGQKVKGTWSHMVADSVEELHATAAAIGLRRSCFQDDPMPWHWHYDLTESTVRRALRLASVQRITWRQMAQRSTALMERFAAEYGYPQEADALERFASQLDLTWSPDPEPGTQLTLET